jgi:maleate cis-trans isomerase
VGATRIGFASPYFAKTNEDAIAFLAGAGIETVHRSEVTDTLDNYGQGKLTPQKVFDLGRAADHPDAQAVVLSCTDMRSAEIIDKLESELCKPVITSNQVMLFATLRHLGQAYEQGYGKLFQSLAKDEV